MCLALTFVIENRKYSCDFLSTPKSFPFSPIKYFCSDLHTADASHIEELAEADTCLAILRCCESFITPLGTQAG